MLSEKTMLVNDSNTLCAHNCFLPQLFCTSCDHPESVLRSTLPLEITIINEGIASGVEISTPPNLQYKEHENVDNSQHITHEEHEEEFEERYYVYCATSEAAR